MADGSSQTSDTANAGARLHAVLMAFRQVGMPLLQALAETPAGGEGDKTAPALSPDQFGNLIDSAILLDREFSANLDGKEEQVEPWVRWALAGAASQVVAAHFRSTGQPLPAEAAKQLAAMIVDLQGKFKTQIPAVNEPVPNTVATFHAKMLETMVPVIGAIAQYSFGRAEHGLLAEVAERLVKTADQVTRALAPAGSTPEQWRFLCWNVLRAEGQIYTECHYAEADRLLYMNPDERAAYFAQHGNVVPMTQVWQAFNQRMAMLATLATYLDLPPTVQLDTPGWQ